MQQSLRGIWEIGYGRVYTREVTVPGIPNDPRTIDPDVVWYRKMVTLPEGDWTNASLILKGARFCPGIFIDGQLVSTANGGMAPTCHLLGMSQLSDRGKQDVTARNSLSQSLNKIDMNLDASRIPEADWWRSNISSCLWDDVILKFHWVDLDLATWCPITYDRLEKDRLEVRWTLVITRLSRWVSAHFSSKSSTTTLAPCLLKQPSCLLMITQGIGIDRLMKGLLQELWSPEQSGFISIAGDSEGWS